MKRFVMVVGLLGLLSVACGDDGEQLSLEDWIAAADAICAEANTETDELPEPQTLEDLGEIGDDAMAIAESQRDDLRGLGLPDEQSEDIERAFELIDEQLEASRELVAAAKDGDEARVQEIVEEATPGDEELDQIAADLGLTECGAEGDE